MKSLLFVIMLVFGMINSSFAALPTYLACWYNGDFRWAKQSRSNKYQLPPFYLVSTQMGGTLLKGYWKGKQFVMAYYFPSFAEARNFCSAMRDQCQKDYPGGSGQFLAYVNVALTGGSPVTIAYADKNNNEVTATCDTILLPQ